MEERLPPRVRRGWGVITRGHFHFPRARTFLRSKAKRKVELTNIPAEDSQTQWCVEPTDLLFGQSESEMGSVSTKAPEENGHAGGLPKKVKRFTSESGSSFLCTTDSCLGYRTAPASGRSQTPDRSDAPQKSHEHPQPQAFGRDRLGANTELLLGVCSKGGRSKMHIYVKVWTY